MTTQLYADIAIVVLAVVFACTLPQLPRALACGVFARVTICVLVLVLCECLPSSLGVPLALLLVLSSVPCLVGATAATSAVADRREGFAVRDDAAADADDDDASDDDAADANDADNDIELFQAPMDLPPKLDVNARKLHSALQQQKVNADAIAQNMDLFKRIHHKRDRIEHKMSDIRKNLKGVKEYYQNLSGGGKR